jgi:xanthine dehydrogenase YagR molybdenum-binding subunit
MSAMGAQSVIGEPITRVDGKAKVTGQAKYAAEFAADKHADAVIVTSTIANGTIVRMDTGQAEKAAGVIKILTPFNAMKLPQGGKAAVHPPAGRVLTILQDPMVHYNNQPIAVVIAETLNQALYAASLVQVKYKVAPAKFDFKGGFGQAHPGSHGKDPAKLSTGNEPAGHAVAAVTVDEIYTTPKQNHNPMEPHATLAQWDGEKLTVHDATQYVSGVKETLAKTFGIPEDNVRVICPYVGGGFGSKGSTWSHVVLAAMASKMVNRPVRIALERPQMFGPVGGRPQTYQHIVLGAKSDGTLVSIKHDVYSHTSVIEDFAEPSSNMTRMLYASPNIDTSQKLVPLNVGTPTFQRAPGEATGTFALEIAMDELAEKLRMDPVELRQKNYAQTDPTSKKEFSSKHLHECYVRGAARFGWSKRQAVPRSVREGNLLIGMGMATATYSANRSPAMALVRFEKNGRITVASGTQDLGTGTYTIMAQVAAATLDLPIEMIDAKLGDTDLPKAPVSGGSQSAASVTPAVQTAAEQARLKLFAAMVSDASTPFNGAQPEDLAFMGGKVFLKKQPGGQSVSYKDYVAKVSEAISATGSAQPDQDTEALSTHSWGAVFAEVAVDEMLGMPHVRRVTGVYDIGTLLNEKTGKSQLIGGIVWGVSLALHESTHIDTRNGRPVNGNLAEYHVPVNADIGEIDVSVLNIADKKFNPLGARGIGEIGITGVAAAVANAIYNATGKRLRDAPITPDKLMA